MGVELRDKGLGFKVSGVGVRSVDLVSILPRVFSECGPYLDTSQG